MMPVEPPPPPLGGLHQLEDHSQARRPRTRTLRHVRPRPNRREDALYQPDTIHPSARIALSSDSKDCWDFSLSWRGSENPVWRKPEERKANDVRERSGSPPYLSGV